MLSSISPPSNNAPVSLLYIVCKQPVTDLSTTEKLQSCSQASVLYKFIDMDIVDNS